VNVLSIDVEDYHAIVDRWWFGVADSTPTRAVLDNTLYLLDRIEAFNARATFFVLGEVTEEYPDLIRRIHRGGHELGVHGHKHRWVHTLTPDAFSSEVVRAKKSIEDIIGQPVLGHRAPAFSINSNMTWAVDVLCKAGFKYDSSIYPMRGRHYGDPSVPLEPFMLKGSEGQLLEIPMTVLEFAGRRWPVCGGGYLRHFPFFINSWAMKKINRQRPVIIYLHPYEFDCCPIKEAAADWPLRRKLQFRLFSYLQHRNRKGMSAKLDRMLSLARFDSISNVFQGRF